MESQRNWFSKPSRTKLKTGKNFKRKNHSDDYADDPIESVSKKRILSERKRRFKQNIMRAIDNEDYDDLEEYYD